MALIEALKDTDASVRTAVAEALGKLGDARAVPALIEALEDEYIVQAAEFALVQIGDERGLDALRSNSKVVSPLIELMNDQSWSSRHNEIVSTLKAIGTSEALEVVNKWRKEHPEADDIDTSS